MPFLVRKLRNQDAYKVVNALTGQVHAFHTTRRKANAQVRILEHATQLKGGALTADEVKRFVEQSYSNANGPVGDYEKDNDISNAENQVFINKKTGKAVIANRGTEGSLADWTNNLLIPLGAHQLSSRHKRAEEVQKKAIQKYGLENTTNVGHSQSGAITRNLNKAGLVHEAINLNPAHVLFEKQKPNEFNIRSSNDVVSAVSALNPFAIKKNNTTIASKGANVIAEHSANILDRLNPLHLFGKGLDAELIRKLQRSSPREVKTQGMRSKMHGGMSALTRKRLASLGVV